MRRSSIWPTATTVVGSAGSGPGTINVTGIIALLYFDNTQTVSNADDQSRQFDRLYDYLYEYDTTGAGNQVLTLASSVTVDVVGLCVRSDRRLFGRRDRQSGRDRPDRRDTCRIDGNAFTNSGTIDAKATSVALTLPRPPSPTAARSTSPTATRSPSQPTTFTTTASSVIAIEANSSVTIEPTNAWSNLGSITLASGASLICTGSTSAASLGSISNSGGTVYIGGTYDNTGQTLDGSASFGQLALYGGTITGGTATSAGVAFTG